MKSKAVLFGINYIHTPSARLRGCANDVKNMSEFLKNTAKYDVVEMYTDEQNYQSVSARHIVHSIYSLAVQSHRHKLEKAWIHFSGHGSQVYDRNRDEKDGKDECILPSDFKTVGVITDDRIRQLLDMFWEGTKVVCIFDCCHSGTIGDLTYKYEVNGAHSIQNTKRKCKANIIMLSGCRDNQTSADAYNVNNKFMFSGAMTSCMLLALKNHPNKPKVLDIVSDLRSFLKSKRFSQVPQLTSSFIVDNSIELI